MGDARQRIDLLLDASLLAQRNGEVEERVGRVRRHAEGVSQHTLALGELLHLDQNRAQHHAPAGILRIVIDLARGGGKRLFALPLLEQRHDFAGAHLRPFAASQSSASAARVCVPSLRTFSSTKRGLWLVGAFFASRSGGVHPKEEAGTSFT
jgi:hypothetical protein